MELVLTGAAVAGCARTTDGHVQTRAEPLDRLPTIGQSAASRLAEDNTAIVPCQKFGYFVMGPQHKNNFSSRARLIAP